MNREPSKGISGCQVAIIVVLVALFILLGISWNTGSHIQGRARMTQASNNARQIIVCLKAWAGENQGNYPDAYAKAPPKTANEVFRLLVQKGVIEDERIFTSPASPFTNDNSIGEAPDYLKALEPGENHWCLVKGVNREANGNTPLIFENPSGVSWPPKWNCEVAGQPKEGRAWKGGKIIIGLNDGSVSPQALESSKGAAVPLEKDEDGKDLFTRWKPDWSYLDVER